jgi:glycosyltransferase involved in cell wall biosynthesis
LKLSVIIPVFNEKSTILEICQRVRAVDIDKEIILVDDGSTDGSTEILKKMEDGNTIVIYHDKNSGKGAAIRSGLTRATGDIVIIQDADLEYDPSQFPKLIKPIIEDRADVVYGSRFVTGDYRRVMFFWHYVGNKLLTLVSNMLTNLNLTDMETCYKAFKKEVLDSITIEENRFGFEPEITAKISKMNLRIYETGISYSGRTYAEGKKIGWKDGVTAFKCILKYNLLQ